MDTPPTNTQSNRALPAGGHLYRRSPHPHALAESPAEPAWLGLAFSMLKTWSFPFQRSLFVVLVIERMGEEIGERRGESWLVGGMRC